MNTRFINFIKEIVVLPKEQQEKFNALILTKTIKKGENFVSAGQLPKSIAFVKKGLFRYYYTNTSGEEFTKGFFLENSVLSSYSAMLESRGSYFSIQALEESEIETINYSELLKLFGAYHKWSQVLIALIQKGFLAKEEREREFLLFDAEQRYRAFLERFPNLEKRIKQHMIASYLRITPESLSRLRKKMNLLP